jgi:hypothetical protein
VPVDPELVAHVERVHVERKGAVKGHDDRGLPERGGDDHRDRRHRDDRRGELAGMQHEVLVIIELIIVELGREM